MKYSLLMLSLAALIAIRAQAEAINLIQADQPFGGWHFNNGAEFPGATGSVALNKDGDNSVLVLRGDFSKGGGYVDASRTPPKVNFDRLSFRMKVADVTKITMRLVDSSSQCHQIDLKVNGTGDWQTVDFPLLDFFGNMGTAASLPDVVRYEKWGGPNDGKWHGPCKLIVFLLGKPKPGAVVDLALSDIKVFPNEGVMFSEGFDAGSPLPKGWEAQGDVSLDATAPNKGEKSLKLTRTLDNIQKETTVSGPRFDAAAGPWKIGGAARADINSPDNSYNGAISVQALAASGSILETIPVTELFKKTEWQRFDKRIEMPAGTTQARIVARLNKADGSFWVDDLSATRLQENVQKRIEKIEIMTDAVGNLFLPNDKPLAHIKVQALRPLKDNECSLTWAVRDYWGAEQAAPANVTLKAGDKKISYSAEIDLSSVPLDIGRYYELHVELPKASATEREFAGIARLPEAGAKKYKPEEIPFSIRNWDNRVKDYFWLSDRLGHRNIGIWGGWDPKPPYKPHAPGMEWIKELGVHWVSTTPAASVEAKGFKEYSEASLREGMTNFLKQYAGPELAFICQGNEPHGKIEKVRENVKAYKAIYEATKSVDPKITVVGTSVEPNEDYFAEGYYQWLDIYDFHEYATYTQIRKTIREYRSLMEKYKAVKPIISTELGLNSQGMPRYTVAVEMVKTFSVFFAEGGLNASWFTIQYPDPKGQARGTSGDAHCVFDCKYSHYNPRLDAVMYYTMLNGICVKKFSAEKIYPDDTQAYLFTDKDAQCMLTMWNDKGRREISVPLGVDTVDVVRIDGRRTTLALEGGKFTTDVSIEPIILFFTQKDAKLPAAFEAPAMTLASEIKSAAKGQEVVVKISGAGLTPDSTKFIAPPTWTANPRSVGAEVECALKSPDVSAVRDGRVYVQKIANGKVCSEILVTIPFGK